MKPAHEITIMGDYTGLLDRGESSMNNPRIYIVIGTFHPLVGGAENQALAQAIKVKERSFEVTVVTFRHDSKWARREIVENIPVQRVAGILLGKRGKLPELLQKFLYVLALAAMGWTLWQQRHRYDVLHVHQFNKLILPVALACWLARKPIIIVVHSTGREKSERDSNRLSLLAGPLESALPWLRVDAPRSSWAGGDVADIERLGKLVMFFTRSLLVYMRAVPVVISSRMKDYLAHYHFHLPGTQLIPNGVDITRFQPGYLAHSPQERASTVICVARLSYEKGIDVLLQAWYLVQQVPDLKARLLIVGSGPHETQLKLLAQELGIADSVEFAGMQSDIPLYLHRSSIAVLPSRWEGMPVALLEAMACGLACVATRVSGSEDIIQHRVNGLLVEPEGYQAMACALLTLLQNPQLVKEFSEEARQTVEKQYSLERITDSYIDLYRRCAGPEYWLAEDNSCSEISMPSLAQR